METVTAIDAGRSKITQAMQQVFVDHQTTYGCRQIARMLYERRQTSSVNLMAVFMRELRLPAVLPRAYRATTTHHSGDHHPPDLLDRELTSTQPGTRMLVDIAHLRMNQRCLYLSTVMGSTTRMVVGWQVAEHMRTCLVIGVLQMARLNGHLQAGAMIHDDREARYASRAYATYCASIGYIR